MVVSHPACCRVAHFLKEGSMEERKQLQALLIGFVVILFIWQGTVSIGLVPSYLLPSPIDVGKAIIDDFFLLADHTLTTLIETILGLGIGVFLGILFALIMDASKGIRRYIEPWLIVSQTIPTVAIAPLLVLWFGYDLLPKVILIVLVTLFPIAMGLLQGVDSVDRDELNLLLSMNASEYQIVRYLKFPASLPHFFSGLKISVTYSVVSAVIAEWLGGFSGLGVYMTRVKRSFAFDHMFAVIFVISFLSLVLMQIVRFMQKKMMPWED